MGKRKTQEEKDVEYFEKMKKSIYKDLEWGRDPHAICWSIGRTSEWWINKITNLRNEVYLWK